MKLTKQQERVYRYILANRGCTTKDIMLNTGIQCPSGRISELRDQGVKITSIGQRRYRGSKAFECYAIDEPLTKRVSQVYIVNGRAVERLKNVEV
ncbi:MULTISPECIES: hypothetical protein [Alphaproteobacteria]|uniref:hypothetical protein n=1 Tax=Alphaproteobacteria TaxID=28211 RepID=UPI003263CEAF